MGPVTIGYPHGTFCWVDLGATDLDAARAFYGELLGWEFVEVPGGGYLLCRRDGSEVAGMHAHTHEEGTRWTSYVCVEDAVTAATRAAGLGGTVVRPAEELPGTARVSVLRDPAGAELCLWEPMGFSGARLVNETGAWSWNELATPDPDAAAAFYGALFGWEAENASGGIGRITFTLGRLLVAGTHEPTEFEEARGPEWVVSFRVDEADAALATVERLGGSVLLPPLDVPVGRLGIVADPAGAAFMIAEVPGGGFRGVDGS